MLSFWLDLLVTSAVGVAVVLALLALQNIFSLGAWWASASPSAFPRRRPLLRWLDLTISFLFCALFVARTVMDHFPVWMRALVGLLVLSTVVLAVARRAALSLVEVFYLSTSVYCIASGFWCSFAFLASLSVRRALLGLTRHYVHPRPVLLKLITLALDLIILVWISSCVLVVCEVAGDPWANPPLDSSSWNLFEAAYVVTVSITTVGYGDLTPTTVLGKIVILVVIVAGILAIANATNAVLELVKLQSQHLDSYEAHGDFKHLVLLGQPSTAAVLDIIREVRTERITVVLVTDDERKLASTRLAAIAANPSLLKILRGGALSRSAYGRARVNTAVACLCVAREGCDQECVYVGLTVKHQCPRTPLFLLLSRSASRRLIPPQLGRAVYLDRFRLSLLGLTTAMPGASTLLCGLLRTATDKHSRGIRADLIDDYDDEELVSDEDIDADADHSSSESSSDNDNDNTTATIAEDTISSLNMYSASSSSAAVAAAHRTRAEALSHRRRLLVFRRRRRSRQHYRIQQGTTTTALPSSAWLDEYLTGTSVEIYEVAVRGHEMLLNVSFGEGAARLFACHRAILVGIVKADGSGVLINPTLTLQHNHLAVVLCSWQTAKHINAMPDSSLGGRRSSSSSPTVTLKEWLKNDNDQVDHTSARANSSSTALSATIFPHFCDYDESSDAACQVPLVLAEPPLDLCGHIVIVCGPRCTGVAYLVHEIHQQEQRMGTKSSVVVIMSLANGFPSHLEHLESVEDVYFVHGSPFSPEALDRTRVAHARVCLLLAEPHAARVDYLTKGDVGDSGNGSGGGGATASDPDGTLVLGSLQLRAYLALHHTTATAAQVRVVVSVSDDSSLRFLMQKEDRRRLRRCGEVWDTSEFAAGGLLSGRIGHLLLTQCALKPLYLDVLHGILAEACLSMVRVDAALSGLTFHTAFLRLMRDGQRIAIALYRPTGTLGAPAPYVYTVPLADTVLVQDDLLYFIMGAQR